MSDNIAYENTRIGETPLDWQSVSQKQIIVPIADSNATNYNGNIRYNITSLQGSFVNWNEAILQIPIQLNLNITTSGTTQITAVNQWAMGMRNGTIHLLDNFELKLNGVQLVTPQQYTNIFACFRMLSSWSKDTLQKVGPSVCFYPDSSASLRWIVAGTANANGDNISNNVDFPGTTVILATAAGQTVAPEVYNDGFYRRQQFLFSYNSIGYGGFLGTGTGIPGIPVAGLVQPAKSYFVVGTPATSAIAGVNADVGIWHLMCQIRLCDYHDIFKKLPFSEYGQVEMTFYYNQFNPTFTTAAGTMVLATVGQQFGNTNPFMIPSAAASNGSALTCAAGNAGTAKLTMKIGNAINSGTQLFIPTYKLDPEYRANLIATRPFSICRYEKMLQNQTTVARQTGFNFNVTPGQANLKYIVVVPYYSTQNNGQTGGAGAVAQFQNPFDSAGGGTTCPLASIVQFNCLVNNNPVLPSNCNYEFDMFLNQVQRINALNASDVDSLNSGLISEFMWTNSFRYYIVCLQREELENSSSPKSVNIIGTNNTNVQLDLFTFLVFENEVKIYTQTGIVEA
jgi:hypothetical protein